MAHPNMCSCVRRWRNPYEDGGRWPMKHPNAEHLVCIHDAAVLGGHGHWGFHGNYWKCISWLCWSKNELTFYPSERYIWRWFSFSLSVGYVIVPWRVHTTAWWFIPLFIRRFFKMHPKGGSYVGFLNRRSMLSPWSLASPPVSLVSTIFCLKPTSWDPPWRDSKGCGFTYPTYPFYRKNMGKW